MIRTDKLWSDGAALRALPVLYSVEYFQVISSARCNNLIEQRSGPNGCHSAQDRPTARSGNNSEVSSASKNHDEHRNYCGQGAGPVAPRPPGDAGETGHSGVVWQPGRSGAELRLVQPVLPSRFWE